MLPFKVIRGGYPRETGSRRCRSRWKTQERKLPRGGRAIPGRTRCCRPCPWRPLVIDREHRVVRWNRALERLSGVSAPEVLGTRDHWRLAHTERHPLLADLVLELEPGKGEWPFADMAAEPCAAPAGAWWSQGLLRGQDGDQRPVKYLACALRDAAGRAVGRGAGGAGTGAGPGPAGAGVFPGPLRQAVRPGRLRRGAGRRGAHNPGQSRHGPHVRLRHARGAERPGSVRPGGYPFTTTGCARPSACWPRGATGPRWWTCPACGPTAASSGSRGTPR